MAKRSYLEFFISPPKSTQDIWGKLETSIEMAINDTAIDDVIIKDLLTFILPFTYKITPPPDLLGPLSFRNGA
jgi:hypothetical protein